MALPETFKVLSDLNRRNILIMLKKGQMTPGEISEKLKMSAAALSYHLNQLKKANLIIEYKYKNFIYYDLNITVFDELIIWLNQFKGEI